MKGSMKDVFEELDNLTITKVLEEYLSDLQSSRIVEGLSTHQPMARFESDFVSSFNFYDYETLFRSDYIRDANVTVIKADLLTNNFKNDAVKNLGLGLGLGLELSNSTDSLTGNLTNEMRLLFDNDTKTATDIELLASLDKYLEKRDYLNRNHSQLFDSIPSSALSLYKENLGKKRKANSLGPSVSYDNSNQTSDQKVPVIRRRRAVS
jgi:hypothetical protein